MNKKKVSVKKQTVVVEAGDYNFVFASEETVKNLYLGKISRFSLPL